MGAGTLFIVATPLGNFQDITLRALETLRMVDAVVCEEARPGSTLLKRYDIQKPLLLLNEHNVQQSIPEIVARLSTGKNLALISDCGTPVFADPGLHLLNALAGINVQVIPIPGPASITVAISVCRYDLSRFVFGGFLPREPQERRRALVRLQDTHLAVILMDAPYRLKALLTDVVSVFGMSQPVMLGCDLTLPGERIIHGSLRSVIDKTVGKKCEFVLIIAGPDSAGKSRQKKAYPSGKRRQ